MRSLCSLCVRVSGHPHSIVARQRLGKHVSASTNTQTTTKELLDVVFSMRSVQYELLYIRPSQH
jgi:hypothetical protein